MRFGRALSAQASSRLVYLIAAAVVFVVLARLLGPEQLGQYAWAASFLAIAIALADGGMSPVLARDLVQTGERRNAWFANFLAFRLVLGMLVALGGIVVAMLLAPQPVRLPVILCCVMLPVLAARFYDPVFQVANRPFLSLYPTIAFVALAPLGIVAATLAAEPVGWAVLASGAAGIAYGVVGAMLGWHLLRPDFTAVGREGMSEIGRATAPIMASALITALAQRVDVLIVAEIAGDAAAGQYNAAYRFVDIGAAMIVTVLMPLLTLFSALGSVSRERLVVAFRACMRLIATANAVVALLAIPLAAPVLRTLYGAAFEPAATALALLAWKLAAAFVSLLAFTLVMATASIRFVIWSSVAALLVILLLNWLLVPSLSATGAAIATLVAELVQMTVNLVMAARAVPGAFERGWWSRFAASLAAALMIAVLPAGGVPALVQGILPTVTFIALMAALRALPGNPLPFLRVDGAPR
jgi:O-antigen/teichoic acid export membrane protein